MGPDLSVFLSPSQQKRGILSEWTAALKAVENSGRPVVRPPHIEWVESILLGEAANGEFGLSPSRSLAAAIIRPPEDEPLLVTSTGLLACWRPVSAVNGGFIQNHASGRKVWVR